MLPVRVKKMSFTDKDVIAYWLALHNQLAGSTYRIADWPDRDSSRKNVDATCVDDGGRKLAIEHTRIQPFENEKADAAMFLQTLATLENHPALSQAGYMYLASQPVGSIPKGKGIKWSAIPKELVKQLPNILPGLRDGSNKVTIQTPDWGLDLAIEKLNVGPGYPGKFLTGRQWPGDPGPEVILSGLRNKIPKLAAADADNRILLLEKDGVAGTIDSQFELVKDSQEVKGLLAGIDEIWTAETAGLQKENVIFTHKMWPEWDRSTISSLDVATGEFWRVGQ
jgi:hypothetical protein